MELRVDSRAIDMFQQCRPSALLGYLQEAATQAALELGASGPQVLEKYNCQWMIARTWVEMDEPLYWNQQFTVHTWHRGGVGASCYRDFDIIRDGAVIGQGVSDWVMVDVDTHKLFRIRNLEEFQGTDGGELCKNIKLHRVKLPETFDSREERTMRYSETDLNGHINNIHYADFACDALHMERYGEGKFVRQFQIGYVGECHAGESIAIDTAVRGDELFARGEGGDGKERFDFAMTLQNLK
jgi:acyl-ACP thioesterase